jgi:thiamine biosynthesis lipoprotein
MRGRSSIAAPTALAAMSLLAAAGPVAAKAAALPRAAAMAAEDPGAPATARARFLMGTRLVVTIPGAAGDDVFERAFAEVARLERVLSNWDADSELSRLNREAAGGPVRCSEDLFLAVMTARRWAEATGGAFDPTVEPLVRRFGLRDDEGRWEPPREAPADAPDAGEPAAMAATGTMTSSAEGPVGWRHLRLHPRTRSVRFDAPGVGVDLGGIGKGIALDAAARLLGTRAVRSALLDFGGQVLAVGAGDGGAWPVGVVDPGDRDRAAVWIALRGASIATSGNGERGGRDGAGHILDPARGTPVAYAGTVTVLAPDATGADALSTALYVMGPERGLSWAESRGIAALYQWRAADGATIRRASRAFPAFSMGGVAAPGRTR